MVPNLLSVPNTCYNFYNPPPRRKKKQMILQRRGVKFVTLLHIRPLHLLHVIFCSLNFKSTSQEMPRDNNMAKFIWAVPWPCSEAALSHFSVTWSILQYFTDSPNRLSSTQFDDLMIQTCIRFASTFASLGFDSHLEMCETRNLKQSSLQHFSLHILNDRS